MGDIDRLFSDFEIKKNAYANAAEVRRLKERIAELEEELNRKAVATYSLEIENLSACIASLDAQNTSCQSEVVELQRQVESLKGLIMRSAFSCQAPKLTDLEKALAGKEK